MNDGRPDMGQRQVPSQKLILPSPRAPHSPPNQFTQQGYTNRLYPPGASVPPLPPFPPNKRNWRKDPAFIVLLAGVCVILIAGTVFAFVASNLLSPSPQQAHTQPSTANTPTTAPTTDSNPGTTPTSQPTQAITVTVQPSPTTAPTAPPQPTATQPVQGQNGPLTVQVNDAPTQVYNNSVVSISVTTSNPNSSVRLFATYNVSPFFSSSSTRTTDANGNTTLSWFVAVRTYGHSNIATAHITIFARDKNNQQATSQTYTVQIQVRGITPL